MGNYDYDEDIGFGVLLKSTSGDLDNVYIQANGLGLQVVISGQSWTAPYRESELVVKGKRHLHRGTITGLIVERNEDGSPGDDVGPREWAQRLFYMMKVANQYTISLESFPFTADKIVFHENYSIDPIVHPHALYRVSLPFVEVK